MKALSDCKQKLEKLSSISDGATTPNRAASGAKSPIKEEPKGTPYLRNQILFLLENY